MTIAIIGTGNIGRRLASHLTEGGVDILLAGRELDETCSQALELGAYATAVTVDEAVERAEILILAVWFDTIRELVATYGDRLRGKIIVDPSNPIAPDGQGGFVKTIGADESSGQLLAALLPAGTRLVKAFGTLSAESLDTAAHRTPELAVAFYATDDEAAGKVVAQLISAAGFDPVHAGGIDASIRLEVFGDLHEFGALGRTVNRAEAEAALTTSVSMDPPARLNAADRP
ncbi:NAD(P)-binding domain-containing protein [Nocardia sp. NPDC052001]|uniref:NADPH-dependent F420 reductase n=1 Tax=Nocardia sp. NPDC052001 TaxID=3154853 RepID=UPI00343B0F1D